MLGLGFWVRVGVMVWVGVEWPAKGEESNGYVLDRCHCRGTFLMKCTLVTGVN